MYDLRLGRWFAVDPLASSYPHNSPYAFSENRVIDGMELEGLEYLDADEARVEFTYGKLRLKVSNFLKLNRTAFYTANANPKNWNSGEIGINTIVGNASFTNGSQNEWIKLAGFNTHAKDV